MLLHSCAVSDKERERFNALVGELRAIRDWIQQGNEAARILEPSEQDPTQIRAKRKLGSL